MCFMTCFAHYLTNFKFAENVFELVLHRTLRQRMLVLAYDKMLLLLLFRAHMQRQLSLQNTTSWLLITEWPFCFGKYSAKNK